MPRAEHAVAEGMRTWAVGERARGAGVFLVGPRTQSRGVKKEAKSEPTAPPATIPDSRLSSRRRPPVDEEKQLSVAAHVAVGCFGSGAFLRGQAFLDFRAESFTFVS
jgi:hypothetical protein